MNNALPGAVLTDRLKSIYETRAANLGQDVNEYMKEANESIPMGRPGKPEEMGDLIAFIASERAGYITGASIPLDGGVLQGTF